MICLLLVMLWLLPGCSGEAVERFGYTGERVDISCPYPAKYLNYKKEVCKVRDDGSCTPIASGSVFRDDTARSRFTLTIKHVGPQVKRESDNGVYECRATDDKGGYPVTLQSVHFWELSNYGYEHGKATIRCTYDVDWPQSVRSFCKFSKHGNERRLASTKVGEQSTNERVSIHDNPIDRVFTVTLDELTIEDSGRYKCRIDHWNFQRRLHVTTLQHASGYMGASVVVRCPVKWGGRPIFCRGEDPIECLEKGRQLGERFIVPVNASKESFSVTISELRAEDAGTYWCAEWSGDGGPEGGPGFASAVHLVVTQDTAAMTVLMPLALLLLTVIIVVVGKRLKISSSGLPPSDTAENTHRTRDDVAAAGDISRGPAAMQSYRPPSQRQSFSSNSFTETSLYHNYQTVGEPDRHQGEDSRTNLSIPDLLTAIRNAQSTRAAAAAAAAAEGTRRPTAPVRPPPPQHQTLNNNTSFSDTSYEYSNQTTAAPHHHQGSPANHNPSPNFNPNSVPVRSYRPPPPQHETLNNNTSLTDTSHDDDYQTVAEPQYHHQGNHNSHNPNPNSNHNPNLNPSHNSNPSGASGLNETPATDVAVYQNLTANEAPEYLSPIAYEVGEYQELVATEVSGYHTLSPGANHHQADMYQQLNPDSNRGNHGYMHLDRHAASE